MDNAIVIALGAVFLALVIGAYLLGHSDGRHAGLYEDRVEHRAMLQAVRDEEFEWHREAIGYVRERAFTRAADAVGLWPHRINRRADLMRHLEALGTAPDLGALLPAEEATTPISPVAEPTPVLTAPVGADDLLGIESGAEGRIDPMEGFL